jgi:single-strand DNA-binding protein
MASLNKVFLAGHLTRDPEIRYIASGKAVADLGLAINRRYRTAAGEEKEETCFVNVTVWGKQAETAGEYLKKGSGILVEGSLRMDQWESNGEKRSRLGVTADRIQFLDKPSGSPKKRVHEPGDAKAEKEEIESSSQSNEATAEQVEGDADNLPF